MAWAMDNKWQDTRQHRRFYVALPAMAIQDGYAVPGTVSNISGGGALFALNPISNAAVRTGPLELDIAGVARVPCRIRWRAAYRCGVEFTVSEQMHHFVETRLNRLAKSLGQTAPSDAQTAAVDPVPPMDPVITLDEPDPALRRSKQRHVVRIQGRLHQDGYAMPCTIIDISAGGLRIRFDSAISRALRDKRSRVDVPEFGTFQADFRWRKSDEAGLSFVLTDRQAHQLSETLAKRFAKGRGPMTDG